MKRTTVTMVGCVIIATLVLATYIELTKRNTMAALIMAGVISVALYLYAAVVVRVQKMRNWDND